MSANLSFPTVPTAHAIGLPWGGRDARLYPASIGHRHPGYDLYAPKSPPIFAIASGTVEWAGYEQAHGYGRHIYIAHEINGVKFHTGYAHLRNLTVKVGDKITNGQQIASMGGDLFDKLRGVSGGPHLHFEVVLPEKPDIDYIKTYRGYSVDPLRWLSDTFLPKPKFQGTVTEPEGIRLRLFPEVSQRATRVGALAYKDTRGFAEELLVDDRTTWLRLNTIRTVWVAARYNGRDLIRYAPFSEPASEAPTSAPPDEQNAYIRRMVHNQTLAVLDDLIALLNEKRETL